MTNFGSILMYEKEIVAQALKDDSLNILALGLGIERVFFALLKQICQRKDAFALILEASNEQAEYFIRELSCTDIKEQSRPCIISSCSQNERHSFYKKGKGVFFVSNRVLIADFLSERIAPEKIFAVVLFNIVDEHSTYQSEMIVRSFRKKNTTGIVMAFVDRYPKYNVESMMKLFQLKSLNLWPRFQTDVARCLNTNPPTVYECKLTMSNLMKKIHDCILDLISACLSEMKSFDRRLDRDMMTIDAVFTKTFHQVVGEQLRSDNASAKLHDLFHDVKVLSDLMIDLLEFDAYAFNKSLLLVKKDQRILRHGSGWIFLDSASKLFDMAAARVINTDGSYASIEECVKENPRFKALYDILLELAQNDSKDDIAVLILVHSEQSSQALKDKFMPYLESALISAANKSRENICFSYDEDAALLFPINILWVKSVVFLSQLYNLKPTHIVIYHPHVSIVRSLEVYQAYADVSLTVYFLMYDLSIEESRYLSIINKEKEAFDKLINIKSQFVITKDALDTSICEKSKIDNEETVERRILVDMREFRCPLPCLLDKKGFKLIPMMLEIGDYVLTPDLCVERKNICDLKQSLESGHMYKQAEALSRAYKRSVILIEFSDSQQFSMDAAKTKYSFLNTSQLKSKLVLLTMHFPSIKLLWSDSPKTSVKLFDDLKLDREEPDPALIPTINVDADNKGIDHASVDLLLQLPGINLKNYPRIINNARNIYELTTFDEEKLADILENEVVAKTLHEFLHKDFSAEDLAPPKSKSTKR